MIGLKNFRSPIILVLAMNWLLNSPAAAGRAKIDVIAVINKIDNHGDNIYNYKTAD